MDESQASELEGILAIDKPVGLTSHDVVDVVRHKLRMRRVGHAGTLDPNATGLIIILVGKATKVSQYMMSVDKSYEGTMKLGEVTNTYDCDGEVMETAPISGVTEEGVRAVFKEFLGDQYQIPPMFSAIKVNGVPLYKLARKGQEIEREPRFIRISKLDLIACNLPFVEFSVACTKGTYVRTLVHDIGRKLNCGAHLIALRRLNCGQVTLRDAISLAKFEEMSLADIRKKLVPIYQAVPSHVI